MFNLHPLRNIRGAHRFLRVFLCVLCVLGGSVLSTFAQGDELKLSVRRDWGYGGGSQIQGHFTMEATGPDTLRSVTFRIDESAVGTVTGPPFKIQFVTDDYSLGWHDLAAVGQTSDGRTLTSNVRRFEFVSAEAGWAVARNIIVPLVSVVGALIIVGVSLQIWSMSTGRKSSLPLGAPRKYGLKGGAICPACHRPFSIHFWSFNVVTRVFDYCDHCGRWGLVRRATADALHAAEVDELVQAQPETAVAEESAEEKLKRQLDESRYLDSR